MEDLNVILFYSSSSALRMEKLCREKGISIKLMPVPRHLSSDCGVCLRFSSNDMGKIGSILDVHTIEYESIRKV